MKPFQIRNPCITKFDTVYTFSIEINHMFKKLMAAAALVTIATAAYAAPTELFFDDFDSSSNIPGGNTTPAGWSVSGGTVDIVGPPSYFPTICAAGAINCIDMDGSSGNAGRLTSNASFSLLAGVEYTLSFDYSWNWHMQGNPNTMTFGVGGFSDSLTTNGTRTAYVHKPYTALSFSFIGNGSFGSIFFDHQGGDNGGIVIDNVRLVGELGQTAPAVPLPAGAPLILTALAGLGLLRRRG